MGKAVLKRKLTTTKRNLESMISGFSQAICKHCIHSKQINVLQI